MAAEVMPAPFAPWAFEIVGPLVWLVLAGWFVRDGLRHRRLSVPALVFIGATSMFWLEWYGDWAAYLLYNPHLNLIEGWNFPLTSGNKPWAVLPAYGWFFGLCYFPLIVGVRRVHDRLARPSGPGTSPTAPGGGSGGGTATAVRTPAPVRTRRLPSFAVTLFAVGLVVHYLWDLLIEGVATQWGLWTYVNTVGPTLSNSRGTFPLLYPVIPFAFQMSLTMVLIDAKRADGMPLVESWLRVDRFTGGRRVAMRVLTWILTMNLTYLLLFIGPIMVIRGLFLPDNPIVP